MEDCPSGGTELQRALPSHQQGGTGPPLFRSPLEVYYKGHFVERTARVHGEGEVNVNYRHVIGSLMRNVGAFARYRFREQLLPTTHFRITYDALRELRGERADVEYVRVLHLAAQTMKVNEDSALSLLLDTHCCWKPASPPTTPRCGTWTIPRRPKLRRWCCRSSRT